MKNILQDIVNHTIKLGMLDKVKITSDDKKTSIFSMDQKRLIVLLGETKDPVLALQGTFGMPQLEKLRYLLEGSVYQEDAKITLVTFKKNDEDLPSGLHFENKDGDFHNDYKFMNSEIIEKLLASLTFKEPTWSLNISPTVGAIQKFQYQAGANSEIESFSAALDGDKLRFKFGGAGHSEHGGEFVFASGVTGTLTKSWSWPVSAVLNVLKSADGNNTKMSISNDKGAMLIELDSGIAIYKYVVPATQ